MSPEQLSRWGRSVNSCADRLQRFNNARGQLIAGFGGAIGLGFSLMAGTFVFWAFLSLAFLLLVIVLWIVQQRDLRRVTAGRWAALAIAPFFNQIAFVSIEIYMLIAVGTLLGMLLPAVLRGAGWVLLTAGDVAP